MKKSIARKKTKKEAKVQFGDMTQVPVPTAPAPESLANVSSLSKKKRIFVFVVLILLVIAAAAWLVMSQADSRDTNVTDTSKLEETTITKDDITRLQDETALADTSAQEKAKNFSELGAAYSDSGNTTDAIKLYNQALAIDASNKQALTGLLYVYANSGQTAQAITVVNQLIILAEKDTSVAGQGDVQKYKVQLDRLQKGLDI